MNRKYDEKLTKLIRKNQYAEKFGDLDVVIKPIPDGKHAGEMDPRVYKSFSKMTFISRFLPKKMFEMKLDAKNLEKLRKIFNNVDSHPMVSEEVLIDAEYVTMDDGEKINLKVYRKNSEVEDRPVLYYIHGGGFFAGSTDVVEEAMKLLVVEYNIVVFSVNYRLAPEYPYPVGHTDSYNGFRWVLDNASKYGGNNKKVFIAGDSAGGNLTQYCTNRSLADGLDNVLGQILLYPALNLSDYRDEYYDFDFSRFNVYKKHERAINMAMGMLDGSMGDLGDLIQIDDVNNVDISPYLEINPKLPPTLLSVGEFDPLRHETIAYGKKLLANDIDVSAVLYRGMPHAYLDQVGNYPQSEDCVLDMGRFIINYAKE